MKSLSKQVSVKSQATRKSFSLLEEYNKRKNKKLINNGAFTDEPMFWVTSARPPSFGEHIDTRTKLDNWFDENRVHNEENRDYEIRRAQMYVYQGFNLAFYALVAKYGVYGVFSWLNGNTRYIRDTYKEVDIGALPPGEVYQTNWNGEPIFIRRLTGSEIKQEEALPDSTRLDKESIVYLSPSVNTQVLVCSAVCTHLGCIPVPYLGAYKGFVCLCHGSVYDKYGRVRQGPALQNLKSINNQVHDQTLCIEEQKFPNEPSTTFYI